MISFIVQNETHALNFAPIVTDLIATGTSPDQIEVLHLDDIFGLKTRDCIAVPGQHMLPVAAPKPYYFMSPYRRLAWLLRVTPRLRAAMARTKVVVIGSDGGVQRVMANAVRQRGGKAILLCDGLLSPWPVEPRARLKSVLKSQLNRLSVRVGLNPYLPSDIGHSSLDRIFVMHEAVEKILREQGVRTPIEAVQLPRFDNYQARFAALRANNPAESHRCLYVTGAYRWHGLTHLDHLQQQDLRDVREFAVQRPAWRVRVRVHPREDRSAYTSVSWPENIELSFSDREGLEDLAWASVMVTYLSTMSVEAELVGLPVVIYVANFSPLPPGSYFDRNPYFTSITNLAMLDQLSYTPAHNTSRLSSSVRRLSEAISAK